MRYFIFLATIATCIVTAPAFAGINPDMSDVDVDWTNLSDDNWYHGQRSLGIFLSSCDGIEQHRFEIADLDARVETLPEGDKMRSDYGWDKVIRVDLSMADSGSLPEEWNVRGKTLHYTLGGGETPGIYGATESSRVLCENKNPRRPVDWDWFRDSFYLNEIDKI